MLDSWKGHLTWCVIVVNDLPSIELRPVRAEDVPVLIDLINELAEYEERPHEVTIEVGPLGEALFGRRPLVEALIAWTADRQPAGFAIWFYTFSTFRGRANLYVEDLFVRPAWRRQGLGRKIMSHLARLAIERGCGRLEWSVLVWNEPALSFYRDLGALPITEWGVYTLSADALCRLAGAGG